MCLWYTYTNKIRKDDYNMYYAVSEVTNARSHTYYTEEELFAELDSISVKNDFWDVYTPESGNARAYYYSK